MARWGKKIEKSHAYAFGETMFAFYMWFQTKKEKGKRITCFHALGEPMFVFYVWIQPTKRETKKGFVSYKDPKML